MNASVLTIVLIFYLGITAYLGIRGYQGTKSGSDYLLGGRQIHPVLLALSYGATFISTSALVGFGGCAALWGLSLFWLVFLNISVGIFLSFVVFGRRTRKIGYFLQAHTFPELFAKRYKSRFLQIFGGGFITLFMPLYTAAVLLGGARLLDQLIPQISFNGAIMIYAIFVAAYVMIGGIKGVIYNDAAQGAIMMLGSIFLIIFTVKLAGGLIPGLTKLSEIDPGGLVNAGHQGWTSMPKLGSKFWWIIVSSITLGVGIGVIVQPQLVVRFMMVKSRKELYRSLIIGGIFILFMTGGAFFVGALSNVIFLNDPEIGKIAFAAADKNLDKIIPMFIDRYMPPWFSYIFLLTIISAAMSTLSSQFHTIGTAVGRDIYEKGILADGKKSEQANTVGITRAGIILTLVFTVVLSFHLPKGIIAIATSMFFGLCSATFLPAYTGTLFWRKTTRLGVIASCLTGFSTMMMLFIFMYAKTMGGLGVAKLIFGEGYSVSAPWNVIDPLLFSLPLSAITLIIVSLCTKDEQPEITKALFKKSN